MRRHHPVLNFFAMAMALMMMAVSAMAYVPIAQDCEAGCGCCDEGKHCPCLSEMPEQSPLAMLDQVPFHALELALPPYEAIGFCEQLPIAAVAQKFFHGTDPPGNVRWRALLSSWLL